MKNNAVSRVDPLRKQNNDRYYHYRTFTEQPRPHRTPLPYLRRGGTSTVQRFGTETKLLPLQSKSHGQFPTQGLELSVHPVEKHYVKAHNKALGKVDEQLRSADSFFEDWYERRQAVALLTNAGKGLFNFVTGWRDPKYWKGLAKESRPKDLPSAWLAYQFGVKPLVGGVDRALNLLSQAMPTMQINGASSDDVEYDLGRLFQANFDYPFINKATAQIIVKHGCFVTGVNPNRALGGATGLNEPFSSLWSVLPWGWAVDYFVNVGELLSNMDNKHPGVTVSGWYTTRFTKTKVSSMMDSVAIRKQINNSTYHNGNIMADNILKSYSYRFDGDYYIMHRTVGSAPSYKMEFKFPPLGGSKQANLFAAIALTMSGIKGK